MKKIFVVGRFDENARNRCKFLAEKKDEEIFVSFYDNKDTALEMAKIVKPDGVVILLKDLMYSCVDFCEAVSRRFSAMPIFLIGAEAGNFDYGRFKSETQYVFIPDNAEYERLYTAMKDYASKKNIKVLLVDDNSVFLGNLMSMLSFEYTVSAAVSAMDALDEVNRSVPDIIFLDYEMPIMSGRDFLYAMRQLEKCKNVKVIFLTGVTDKARIMELIELKPDGYMVKPVAENEIKKMIDRMVKA